MLVPPVGSYGGPFAGRPLGEPRGPQPGSEGEIVARASLYLALMTDYCFGLIKATGPVIVEGSLEGQRDLPGRACGAAPAGDGAGLQ